MKPNKQNRDMKTKPVEKTETPVVKVDKKTVVKSGIKKVAFPKKLKRQIEDEIGAPIIIMEKIKNKSVKKSEKKVSKKPKKKIDGKSVTRTLSVNSRGSLKYDVVSKKKSGKKSPKKKASAKKASVKKVAKVSKPKSVTAPKVEVANKVTKLKVWMMEHGINQKELAKNTSLSTNTINRLVNNGHATRSIIKLVAYELKISVEQITELLKFSEPISHETTFNPIGSEMKGRKYIGVGAELGLNKKE